jgi:hypothetical protein
VGEAEGMMVNRCSTVKFVETSARILVLTLVMANSIVAHQVCDRITVGVKDSVGDSFPSPAEWNKPGEFLRLPVRPETT